MIASKESFEPHSSEQLPNSKRIYLRGQLHAEVQVPVREIAVGDTKSYTGAVEKNAPVRVYDCSGPWGDPNFTGKSDEGLPALRADWISKRGDVEEHAGREVKPMDNGYLSGKHAEFASNAEKNRLVTVFLRVKKSTASVPCACRSPRNESFQPENGKKATGAATPMLTPIMPAWTSCR